MIYEILRIQKMFDGLISNLINQFNSETKVQRICGVAHQCCYPLLGEPAPLYGGFPGVT